MTSLSPAGRRSRCPINIALEIFGDRWSLLVVRDLMLARKKTFAEFAASPEGIATNILTDRLRRLEAAGLLGSAPDPEDGRRRVYRLTRKGIALAPVLAELILWSGTHEETAAPPALLDRLRRDREGFVVELRDRWAADETADGLGAAASDP
jgi:DNA-binding HxlR family transcriptional regulator